MVILVILVISRHIWFYATSRASESATSRASESAIKMGVFILSIFSILVILLILSIFSILVISVILVILVILSIVKSPSEKVPVKEHPH